MFRSPSKTKELLNRPWIEATDQAGVHMLALVVEQDFLQTTAALGRNNEDQSPPLDDLKRDHQLRASLGQSRHQAKEYSKWLRFVDDPEVDITHVKEHRADKCLKQVDQQHKLQGANHKYAQHAVGIVFRVLDCADFARTEDDQIRQQHDNQAFDYQQQQLEQQVDLNLAAKQVFDVSWETVSACVLHEELIEHFY